MGIFLSLSLSFILFRFLSSLRCVYSMRNLRGEEEKKKKRKTNKWNEPDKGMRSSFSNFVFPDKLTLRTIVL